MAFTESVRSFQVPATPGTIAWPPSLPSVPTSRATRVTSDALGEVLPHAGHAADLCLAAELPFGADLAGDARHFRGEHVELLDHRVDDLGGAQELAFQRPAVDIEAPRGPKGAPRDR